MQTIKRLRKPGYFYVIGGFAAFNIIIHLAAINNMEFHRDELLYFSLGLHPDFGYASVPPMIGWIAALLQNIFGHSVFVAKMFPAALSGFFVFLSAAIARELGGGKYAQILAAFAILIPPFALRTFHLFQPVHLDLLFWTLAFYYSIRYANTRNNKYLIILGAVFGFALLNKYLAALLIFALLIAVLFSPYRNVFKRKAFYIGMALGLLIFMPNLIWQFTHGLPVVHHFNQLNQYQLVHVNRFDFFIDQALMMYASFVFFIAGIVWLIWRREYRYILISVSIVVVILVVLRGKSYYTLGVLPVVISAGAVAMEKAIKRPAFRVAFPAILVLLSLPNLPISLPVYKHQGLVDYFKGMEEKYGLTSIRRFEDGSIHSLPQDYADQLGWEELTRIAGEAYRQIPDKSRAIIYCENYGQAGAIAILGKKQNLPHPVSFNESFLYWAPKEFHPDIEYLVYINDEVGDDINELFTEIRLVGKISNIHAREYGTAVYLCMQPAGSFNEIWKNALKQYSY